MYFWKQKLGDFIYECHYEKLVTNQEDETRKILKYCNLGFEDRCINYTENKIPVSTASISKLEKKFIIARLT